MKIITQILLILLIPIVTVFSRDNANIPINISINIDKAGKAEIIFGSLVVEKNFTSKVLPIVFKNPEEGIKLRLKGKIDKEIYVTYKSVELKGEKGKIIFTPNVEQTSSNYSYKDAVKINSGISFAPQSFNLEQYLYLWISGEFSFNNNLSEGNYTGILEINISY